ncbi:integrase [Pseudomonas aeruginosa]|nr:site-specific integrase [Pseudomonas aeruginosa]ELQ4884378.1 site-specific integrase [Pseudomonas aeruginosa]KSE75286.1 integrase [Pseudomonas aeruginosa]KSH18021.1 integrase [Pseudomonas aeruginosa]KSO07086.1 integrase [Pseudomonas aeruginosa]
MLKGMQPGCKPLSESLPGRGTGAIMFKRPGEAAPSAFFRYYLDGKQKLIKIGDYRLTHRSGGMTLTEIRDKAQALSNRLRHEPDLRAAMEADEALREAERRERIRQFEALKAKQAEEAARGSLGDLLGDYVGSRRGKVGQRQLNEWRRVIDSDIPASVISMKCSAVTPAVIEKILTPIWNRGAPSQAEKVRALLRAAFQFGLTAEHTIGRSSGKRYALTVNPVDAVRVNHESQPVERALTDAELRQFWTTIEVTDGIGPVMALLFKFVIATGGQRIAQVAREPWASFDVEKRVMRLIDSKGRGSVKRIHLVPLSDQAVGILQDVFEITGGFDWPWTTRGKAPFVVTSFTHAIADWCRSEHAMLNGTRVPRFTPRDLRRTCTQLMQRHGVPDEQSDLLQSHGQSGVVGRHYRNSPEAYLPMKVQAMEAFDRALNTVMAGLEKVPDS